MAEHGETFEQTYPHYAFAPLVRLGIAFGRLIASVRYGSAMDERSLPAHGTASLR